MSSSAPTVLTDTDALVADRRRLSATVAQRPSATAGHLRLADTTTIEETGNPAEVPHGHEDLSLAPMTPQAPTVLADIAVHAAKTPLADSDSP